MKTFQLVGAGAGATGNNAPVTPGAPPWAVGDLVLIVASIRNSGTGKVVNPAGWKALHQVDNTMVMSRFMVAGDVMPTVTFTGGAANADTMAVAYAVRFAYPDMDLLVHSYASQLNGAAQNVAVPALPVTRDGCLILNIAWKADDSTGGSRAGFAALTFATSTAGTDATQMTLGKIQGSASPEGAGTITVTGGAAAISYGIAIALRPFVTSLTTVAPTDSACNLPEKLAAAASEIGAWLTELEESVSVAMNRVAVKVSSPAGTPTASTPALYGVVQWMSVDIDPTGVADLVADPSKVVVGRGTYMIMTALNPAYSGVAGALVSAISDYSGSGMSGASSTQDLTAAANPPTGGAEVSGGGINYTASTAYEISAGVIPAVTTLWSSSMSFFRLSD